MCAVLCSEKWENLSQLITDRIASLMRDAEVNNNVRNINNLWGVLTSFVILYYFSI